MTQMTIPEGPLPVDVETDKRRRGVILLLVIAPILLLLGTIMAGLTELAVSLHSPPPAWLVIMIAVVAVVVSLFSPIQLLAAAIAQIRRGFRTGLSWAGIWVGAALTLLGLLSIFALAGALLSRL
jgi:hypothetical protein